MKIAIPIARTRSGALLFRVVRVNAPRVRSPYAVCTAAGLAPHSAKWRRCVEKVSTGKRLNPLGRGEARVAERDALSSLRMARRYLDGGMPEYSTWHAGLAQGAAAVVLEYAKDPSQRERAARIGDLAYTQAGRALRRLRRENPLSAGEAATVLRWARDHARMAGAARRERDPIRSARQFGMALGLLEGLSAVESGVPSTRLRAAGTRMIQRLLGRRMRVNPQLSSAALAGQAGLAAVEREAGRRFARVARPGVPGTLREVARKVAREAREATAYERDMVRNVRALGGVRRPDDLTAEEFRARIPRSLAAARGKGVPADELAQDLATRGIIRDAYRDTLFDWLDSTWRAAQVRKVDVQAKDLEREARRLVDRRARDAARDVARAAAGRARELCPRPNPAEKIMRAFHGDVRRTLRVRIGRLPKKAYEVGKLEAVVYKPPRWSRIGPQSRIHWFENPLPRLCGFTDRSPWLILGGGARFTSRGFVG